MSKPPEPHHAPRPRGLQSRTVLSEDSTQPAAPPPNPFTAPDVSAILRERDWLGAADSPETLAWCERAAALLGPHADSNRDKLAALLSLVFHYDAREILQQVESHLVLAREGARLVIRHLALLILEGGEVDSDRFKEIIAALKQRVGFSGRGLFFPVRLALAGRPGEGALDRVILLLDSAARAGFAVPVKGTRQRMLEFCAALE